MPTKIDLFFFDAGGGHRAAATALQAVIEKQRRPWQVRLLNLQDVLDSLDMLRRLAGIRIQDFYNLMLRRGWTVGAPELLKCLHAFIRTYHPKGVREMRAFWEEDPPDMVVSVIPNFNRTMFEALKEVRPEAPYVTILTDLADYPPHFWIENQDQWVICGTDRAVEQAIEIGIRPERALRATGMILRPEFYEPISVDRGAERKRLGLDPDLPTGLVLFGGQGSRLMVPVVERLQHAHADLQLICICGRNRRLAEKLRQVETRFPIHVEEFTTEIPYYMHIADFLIGKPGPGTISEAIAMNLPVIVQCNRWTLPQERFNAEWVVEHKIGLVVPWFQDIARGAEQMLAPGALPRYRAAAKAMKNRAVFEIPEMLQQILDSGG